MKEQEWTTERIKNLCVNALHVSEKIIKDSDTSAKEEVDNGDQVNTATKADVAISHALVEYFRTSGIPAVMYTEELGRKELSPKAQFLIGIDDIDGTENWRRSEGVMPYTTIIVVYANAKPIFSVALVAVMQEHTSGHIWLAVRGEGCYFKKKEWNDFQKCYTSAEEVLSRKTAVRLDLYAMAQQADIVARMIEATWVKDAGSSGYHLAAVANGSTDAFVNSNCKGHEFGAGYLLIKEAGGFVSNWKGEAYDNNPFDFDAKYDLVCAATERLGEEVLRVIQ